MEYQSFYNLIESVFEDEHFEMFVKDEELMRYCYGVAGTVGEVLSPILTEQPSHETYEVARELGEALQLTNILRDVGEDFEKGRIYFSREMLNQYDVNIEDVYQQQLTDNYINLWEHYAQIAEKDYQFALDHLNVFKPEARLIIELAARIYKGIIDEVRVHGYPLHRRVYVSRLDKLNIYRQVKAKYNK
ncbi:Dehydrosqualene synthase [Streptococcus pneumoniae]|nr:Dehydrosqualene synthase [Streptococcus pneumoniae]